MPHTQKRDIGLARRDPHNFTGRPRQFTPLDVNPSFISRISRNRSHGVCSMAAQSDAKLTVGRGAGVLDFSLINSSMTNPTLLSVFYAFLLSFVLGTVIAITYIKSFQGLSYSRNFIHSLVLCPIIIAIAMQAIGDNVARGIGMIGALSLLRFRTNIKDPRDMFFVFASMTIGLACGVHSYGIGIVGVVCFVAAVFILSKTPFAYGPQYDGLLRLSLTRAGEEQRKLEAALGEACKHFALISIREVGQGERLDYSYQVKLKTGRSTDALVQELGRIENARGVNLMMQESVIEV